MYDLLERLHTLSSRQRELLVAQLPPLAFSQQRLWFLHQLDPSNALYNIRTALRLTGQLNVAALEQTVTEVCRRHQALRTSFVEIDAQPLQVISPARYFTIPVIDLSFLSPDERDIQVKLLSNEEARRPFDLAKGPLLRVQLLRLAEAEHVLLFTMHHIVSDAWSMSILIKEVAALYEAFSRARPSPLPELSVQYADYAIWQREWLQGEVLEKQLTYWREQLGGELPVLELPTDRARPPIQTYVGAHESVKLSGSVTEALKELSRREGVTLFMTLLAAFQTLLYRYTGQKDIIVGSPIAGRNRQETEHLIGFFVNTLALRTDLGDNPSFQQLLKRVREVVLGSYAHQDVPFEKLVEVLQPERDLSRPPLFQAMFILQNVPLGALNMPNLNLVRLNSEGTSSKFDLTLLAIEKGNNLACSFEYNTDLFDASTMRKMLRHFTILLEGITANPNHSIAELPLLDEAEREEIVYHWNETHQEYPAHICTHELFEQQVERTPDAVALVCAGQEISYAELNARANQLAHYLREQGVGAEVRVGLCLERSIDMIAALFGILKAGGAYVPLDPTYPTHRLSFMMEDAELQVLVSEEQMLERLPVHWGLTIVLDMERDAIAEHSTANPERTATSATAANLAYVIYTSGSTGTPKGVAITHASLLNYLCWASRYYPFTDAVSVPLHSSLSFDLTVTSLFCPLLVGRFVHLLAPATEAETLSQLWTQGKGYSVVKVTPAHLAVINPEATPERMRQWTRALVVGGEALRWEQVREWVRAGVRVYNEYGPTETVVGSCVYEVRGAEGEEDRGHGGVLIGKPMSNTQLYILDERMEVVGVGIRGELYIGGAGVARGYLHRPELTAERFVPHPYSRQEGARLYRTGDVARYLEDGSIEYVGRADTQVKVRGYRIELGEIEAVVSEHPLVQQCVVAVREEAAGDQRIVAYVVWAERSQSAAAAEVEMSSVREYVGERVPAYMVPQGWVVLEQLPLSANGKIDRRALPAPTAQGATEAEQELTPVEEMMEGIWREVLHVERVGVEENFFERGGHSLLGTQVVSRIREVFGVEVALRSLFEEGTLGALSRRVEVMLREQASTLAPPLVPVSRDRELPLSFAQQRLWFLQQLEPDNGFYNIPTALRLRGSLNIAALEQTLSEVVRRHEVLRTFFWTVGGQPQQVISPPQPIELPITDLSQLPVAEREATARDLARKASSQPFNLAVGPLLRVRLLRLDEEDHALLCTMHHIVSDGWSMGILIKEVATLYEAFGHNLPSPLPELPVQYADYAVWQREWLQGTVLEEQLAYWRGQLGGELPTLELPTDRTRPAVQSYRGARLGFRLPVELTQQLKQLSQREGATLFMTLLAAFQTLLSRYSGQRDIIVGTDIANRNRKETEPLIGFFINQLVLRTDLSGDPPFRELLRRVREVCLGAYAHQDVPFEKLVEELQPERDASRSPLFQVKFVLQNAPRERLQLGGLQLGQMGVEAATARYDLALLMVEQGDQLGGNLIYNTDLFEAGTVERLVRHLTVLLEATVAQPDKGIGELALLEEAERAQSVYEWNETSREHPAESCLHELFEQQVEHTPDAVAVVCGEEQFSYAELNARANQLAHYLREQGVGAEVRVGLCLERSVEMMVALLGILKAGGAYVPLDPTYPVHRLSFMMEDAQLQVLVSEERMLDRLPVHWGSTVVMDGERDAIAVRSTTNPERTATSATSANLAYVIYTSGSTGTPKGVAITHASLLNYLSWASRYYPFTDAASVPLHSSLSFDLTVTSLFCPLLLGRFVHLLAPATEAETLSQLWTQGKGYSVVKVTPAHLAAINPEATPERMRQWTKALVVGGEALRWEQVREWVRAGVRVYNEYGPTETVVGSCVYEVRGAEGEEERGHGGVLIGRPVSNTQLYILDERMEVVGVGIRGELYIGGAGVARGYLHRPELTAERFVPHPYSRQEGARLYRTGDVARYLEDGSIEYVGRADTQVKVRGYRIELGEIEAVVSEHPAVQQCVVAVKEEAAGDQRIVAYVVWAEQGSEGKAGAEIEELKRYVRERVPAYMVPQGWVVLEQLPLSANGKIDRRALPAPTAQGATEAEQELTPVEEMMEGIWREVLHVERVGVEENFFERGGHSLLGTQVVSRIREVFGVEVALRSLFEEGTLGALSRRVEVMLREQASTLAPPLVPVSRDRELPLSFAQQRLWFLHQLEPYSASYNVPAAVRLGGSLHVAALEQTLSEVVRRHEALRTCFLTVGGQPQQIILPPQPIELPITDLSGLPDAEREAAARRLAREAATQPFDLSRGPLLRVRLLRLDEEDHVLLFTMHHIVSDGWSMGILIREVVALYESFSHNLPSPLPELPVQYADYAVWQREWLQGTVLEEQLAYWRGQLGGELPTLELPTDRTRPAVQSYRGARLGFRLPVELTQQLKQLSQREGATLFMTLLAAFQTLLSRYSGQRDIIVGTDIANRNRKETEPLIGFFINQLVLRTDLSGEPGFVELLGRVRSVCLGAYAHQDVPFEKLVEELQPERDASRPPLFQVKLVLQNAPREQLRMSGVQVGSVGAEIANAKFDLTLLISEQGEELRAAIEYSTDLFEAETIERLTRHLTVLLEAIVAQPERSISELGLLEEAERAQIVYEWNETSREYLAESCLHELFEQQVGRTPDAVAVVCGVEQLSYAELNARANQLAHYLREQGVGAEVRVGLCLERSVEMMVALLGILKAGGAYVPLDPTYPVHRLSFMMEDAQLQMLVSEERMLERLPVHWGSTVVLDAEHDAITERSSANPERTTTSATAANLAYVIYTSGSTGTPKGVAITHSSLLNYLCWASRYYPFTDAALVPLHSSLSFDLTVTSLFCPLLVGRFVHLLAPATEAETLSQLWTQGGGYSVVKVTPAHLAVINPEATPERMRQWTKALVVGGEALRWEQVREWVRAGVRVYNEYGPTETVVGSCVYEVRGAEGEEERGHGGVLIGRPVSNTQLYILDERMEVVGVGIRGELYIGGAGVARGYLHRPELTAERFVPHPFSRQEGARLYRTGDVARYLEDGSIEYVGRADTQVKVRGYRIELGEIEAVVSEHPLVQQCVVAVREDVAGDQRIVAYVVWAEQGSEGKAVAEIEALKGYVRERVPMYMMPQGWVVLEQLPLSANGKVDRKALPAPTASHATETKVETELTPVEEMMEGIWREVLQVESVGVEENFFERGGHSLLATQVISRVRETFHVDLPLQSVFDDGTLGALSRKVEAALREQAGTVTPPLVPVSRDRELPLSFSQQRLWFLQQLEPENAFYNSHRAVRLRVGLNVAALEQTLSEVMRRHEVLRTAFVAVDGQPRQVICAAEAVQLPVVDLSHLPGEDREREARELVRAAGGRPFDLACAPLLRVILLRMDEAEYILILTMHHIVSDAWSMRVLIKEVATLYEAFSHNLPSPLPELPVQYADYAVWQREWLQGEVLEQQLAYWRGQLGGELPALNLPTDRARPLRPSYHGERQSFRIVMPLAAQLRELSRREGTTMFMTLLAAFQTLLHRYSGQDDIIIGTASESRNRAETEPLIGFFVNQLVLRTQMRGEPTFRELLARVRGVCLGAYTHQDVPFEKLVEELQPERNLSGSPIIQVTFGLQNATRAGTDKSNLGLSQVPYENNQVRFDLTLWVTEMSEELNVTWAYSTDIFEAATIRKMHGSYDTLLQDAVANPDKKIGELELISEKEKLRQATEERELDEMNYRRYRKVKPKSLKLTQET